MDQEKIGVFIQTLRKEKGLTQNDNLRQSLFIMLQ